MSQTPFLHPALLPTGFRDVLPPEAELEARSVATIMDCFAAHNDGGFNQLPEPW